MPREPIPQERIDEQFWTPQQSVAPSAPKEDMVGRSEATVSLAKLGNSIPKAMPAVKPPAPAAKSIPGDEVMKFAQSLQTLNRQDIDDINLFARSKQNLEARMQADPDYAVGMVQRLSQLKHDKLAEAIINESDKMLIADRAKTDRRFQPDAVAAAESGVISFFDEATFGQLSRISGALDSVFGDSGKTAAELIAEHGETYRLLQKAHPTADFVGRAASYMMPNSPARAAFTAASRVGERAAIGLLKRVATSPRLEKEIVKLGLAGVAGAGAVGATKGFLGQDNEDPFQFDRALKRGATEGLFGGAISAAFPVAGSGIRGIQAGLGKLRNGTVKQASNIAAEAYQAYNKNPEAIAKAFGTEASLGAEIVGYLQNAKASRTTESQLARELLPQMPDVDASKMLKFMRAKPGNVRPDEAKAYEALNNVWADWTENQIRTYGADPSKKVPAAVMRDVIDDLQKVAFDKDNPGIKPLLRQAQHIGNEDLLNVARTQGKMGEAYEMLMGLASKKQGLMKAVLKQAGRTPEEQVLNAERLVKQVHGENKTVVRSMWKQLDDALGTNLVEVAERSGFDDPNFLKSAKRIQAQNAAPEPFLPRSENALYSRQFGEGGPGFMPNFSTGAAIKSTIAGNAFGGLAGLATGNPGTGMVIGNIIGGVAASPRANAMMIGATDKLGKFVQLATENPRILEQISRKGYPPLVRDAAKEISKTLKQDGPLSAGSSLRLLADTPYFFALAQAFFLESKKHTNDRRYQAIKKSEPQSQGIARPNQ